MTEQNPFANLTYDDFRRMAVDPALSHHQKVGFPDEYREGREELIFADIRRKLRLDDDTDKLVVEIGPGCSRLPRQLIDLCAERNHSLVFIDSAEMLDQLPDAPHLTKLAGCFPDNAGLDAYRGKVDRLLAYSVIQYPHQAGALWKFLDAAADLLNDEALMLLGDVPNASMRRRYFQSAAGIRAHRAFVEARGLPSSAVTDDEPDAIDDELVLKVIAHLRTQNLHAWVVPQHESLPMANRREDLLVVRP